MDKELQNIIDNNKVAYACVMVGEDLFDHNKLYDELYAYYLTAGMPYGIAKARTGDPVEWITDELNTIGVYPNVKSIN